METQGPSLSSPYRELRIHTRIGSKETSTPLQHGLLQQALSHWNHPGCLGPHTHFSISLNTSPAYRMQCLMPLTSRGRERERKATSSMTSCSNHTAQPPSALGNGQLRLPPSDRQEGKSACLGK